MTHALKTTLEMFDKISNNTKNFELRKMDRPFKNGDKLLLQEWDGEQYTGRELSLDITDVFAGEAAEKYGLRKGFGIISFCEERNTPTQAEWKYVPPEFVFENGQPPITIPPPNF